MTKLDNILKEIVATEAHYVEYLVTLRRYRTEMLKRKVISPADAGAVFCNVTELIPLHEHLLASLQAEMQKDRLIGRVFTRVAPFLSLYTQYVDNYEMAIACLQRLQRAKKKVSKFLTAAAAAHPAGLNLQSLLVMPIQRIPRYRLLLQVALKATPPDADDYLNLSSALRTVEKAADTINDSVEKQHSRQCLWAVQEKTQLSLFLPSRQYVMEGRVTEVDLHTSQHTPTDVYLLSDALLAVPVTASGGPARGYRFLQLRVMTVTLVGDAVAPHAFKVNTGSLVHVFACDTNATRTKWADTVAAGVCIAKGVPLHVEPYQAVFARRNRIVSQPALPCDWRCVPTGHAKDDVCFWNSATGAVSRMHPESYTNGASCMAGLVVRVDEGRRLTDFQLHRPPPTPAAPAPATPPGPHAADLPPPTPLPVAGGGSSGAAATPSTAAPVAAAAPAAATPAAGRAGSGASGFDGAGPPPSALASATTPAGGGDDADDDAGGRSALGSGAGTAQDLPGAWTLVNDGEDVFYYNPGTGESRWTPPSPPATPLVGATDPAAAGAKWRKYTDADNEWYVCEATGESQWERPAGYESSQDDGLGAAAADDDDEEEEEGKVAGRDAATLASAPPAAALSAGFSWVAAAATSGGGGGGCDVDDASADSSEADGDDRSSSSSDSDRPPEVVVSRGVGFAPAQVAMSRWIGPDRRTVSRHHAAAAAAVPLPLSIPSAPVPVRGRVKDSRASRVRRMTPQASEEAATKGSQLLRFALSGLKK